MSRGFDWETTAGVHWSKREKDFMCGAPTGATRALLSFDFVGSDTFKQLMIELEHRGYDITTMRFSVKKRNEPVKECLSIQFKEARKMLEPMRSIRLETIKRTLEEEQKQSIYLYEEVCRALRGF